MKKTSTALYSIISETRALAKTSPQKTSPKDRNAMNNNSGMRKASPLRLLLLWTCLAFAAVATPLSAQEVTLSVTPELITTGFEEKDLVSPIIPQDINVVITVEGGVNNPEDDDWVWRSDKDWLTAVNEPPPTGPNDPILPANIISGSKQFFAEVSENDTGDTRVGVLTFTSVKGSNVEVKVQVVQLARAAIALPDTVQSSSSLAQQREIAVITSPEVPGGPPRTWVWNSSEPTWLTSDEPDTVAGDRTGNDRFTYKLAENTTGKTREADLIFSPTSGDEGDTRVLRVIQFGVASVTLDLSQTQVATSFEAKSNLEVSVISNTDWTWVSNSPWLKGVEEAFEQTGTKPFTFSVSSNGGNEPREGEITFFSKTGGLTATLTVVQTDEGTTFLDISKTVINAEKENTPFPETFQFFSLEVSSNTDWTWESSDDTWLTSFGDGNGSGNGNSIFFLRVARNQTGESRQATITFESDAGDKRTLTVIQAGDSFSLSASTVTLGQEANDPNESDPNGQRISVSSNTDWSWSSDVDWLLTNELVNQSGNNFSFDYGVTENTTGEDRTGTLSFETTSGITATLVVTQAGSLAVSNSAQTITSTQQTRTVEVFAAAELSWVWASSDPGWLNSVGEALEQKGNQTFSYRVAANDTEQQRSATLTFFSQNGDETATLVVNQLATGESGGSFLVLSDAEQATDSRAKTSLSVEVTASNGTQWTWQSSEASWLSAPGTTTRTGTGLAETFNFTVAANNTAEIRSGRIIFTAGDLTQVLTVTQAAAAAATSISPASKAVAGAGERYTIAVTSNTSWTVTGKPSWATVSPASGSANGAVTVTVAANTATTTRNATIIIGGQNHKLTQAANNGGSNGGSNGGNNGGPTGPGADASPNDIPAAFRPKSAYEPALRLAVPAGKARTVHVKGVNGTEGIALIEFFALGKGDSSGTATLGNLSTRAYIGTRDDQLIAGIVVGGTGTKRVLITGRGASIKAKGKIANTKLRVVEQSTKKELATSDDYASEKQAAEIKATNKVKTIAATDAAVILELKPGAYTVVVSGKNGATGIGIVEIFDLDPDSSAKILNLSTRGRVGTGDKIMIGGLIAAGKSGEFAGVITRVKSQSSAAYRPGPWLADPRIEVYDGANKVLENDDWTIP